ncbi:MAG TPA: ABC transporter substrate-binding protein [Acidobacteriota bacterium]|nr:ABC transporter substrate-binding protein [Acidobacteriota bacterium]
MARQFLGVSSRVLFMVVSFYGACLFGLNASLDAAQKELQKLTVGYTPVSGAALPFFVAVEEKLFQKHGFDIAPVFMGGSPLINSAILAGEFPIGYTGGGAVLASRLAGSDLIVIGSPLPVLTIDAWARPEIKSLSDLRGNGYIITTPLIAV